MRTLLKWISAPLVVYILISFLMGLTADSQAVGSTKTYENAVLMKQQGERLSFLVDREERISAVSGRLAYHTRILNENNLPISSEQMNLGSIWVLKLRYPIYEEDLPVILEMHRVKGAEPK